MTTLAGARNPLAGPKTPLTDSSGLPSDPLSGPLIALAFF